MRKITCYITASLDGFIADPLGGVDWLQGAPGEDYGYGEFYDSVDTILLGRTSYEWMLDRPGPFEYADKQVYVFTSDADLRRATDSVHIVTGPAEEAVARLKIAEGGPIWLGGGGSLFTSLFDAGLVDEIRLFVQPMILGDGIPLFARAHQRRGLSLIGSRVWPGDLVELHYRIPPRWRPDIG